MELYDFNSDVYNRIVKIVKFRFYKEIKDTGIVFTELLFAENLVTNASYYVLICDDQETTHIIRFNDSSSLLFQLICIAKKRLQKLEHKEFALMRVNNTEAYGEAQYYNDTEMTAIGIYSIKNLLKYFEEIMVKLNK